MTYGWQALDGVAGESVDGFLGGAGGAGLDPPDYTQAAGGGGGGAAYGNNGVDGNGPLT